MGPLMISSINFIWCLLLVLCAVRIHVEANGWLNAHATFYGANQSPTSLGMSYLSFRDVKIHIKFYFLSIIFIGVSIFFIYNEFIVLNLSRR